MGHTMIEKILGNHAGHEVSPGDIADVEIDVRAARDFGGANVVKNLEDNGLGIHDPMRTVFTFDCNPGGSDQKYAKNQHICRLFARKHGLKVYDITAGIGTHVAIEEGLIVPGGTLVSTDSHANIMGCIGAFGQGMGDRDIAHAFAHGRVWFKVPPSVKIELKGTPSANATPKDVALACLRVLGANGLLGYAAEFSGSYADSLDLPGRITISSLATEMGGIIAFFKPNEEIIGYFENMGRTVDPVLPDPDASYVKTIEVNINKLQPMIARPGHPEDVVPVNDVRGRKIDSAFIGSCTNGRYEDLVMAALILKDRKVAPGVVLKIVPATNQVWKQCLDTGIIGVFKSAGALVGNAGCAGCAAGQIGQTGEGEVTVSSGNRNFAGKQGLGEVYLASPATVAASAIAGYITTSDNIPKVPMTFETGKDETVEEISPHGISAMRSIEAAAAAAAPHTNTAPPMVVTGRAWVIPRDNIDTDMIFHNQYLSITDIKEMGQYTFDNLEGFRDFAKEAKKGDIVVTGKNFGAGSSRAQAVDCFKSLGIPVIVAESFGSIYERNAINSAMPIIVSGGGIGKINDGDQIRVDFESGMISDLTTGKTIMGKGFAPIQKKIYLKGGLLE
jgi:3-isopropylmalate/(R)-2-methylmalate dehydratase large subunit